MTFENFQWILANIPNYVFEDIKWIVSPYIALVLCGLLSHYGKRFPAFLCGLFPLGYFFVVIVDQVVRVYPFIEEAPVLGVIGVIPVLFLVGGLLTIYLASFGGGKTKKEEVDESNR